MLPAEKSWTLSTFSPAVEPLTARERALAAELAFWLEEMTDIDVDECESIARGFVRWAKDEQMLWPSP